jgi:choline dehydrogenase
MKNDNHQSTLREGAAIDAAEWATMRGRLDRRGFLGVLVSAGFSFATADAMAQQAVAVQANQEALANALQASYDYIVVGAGSSGCVVARRLAENPAAKVLLIEAGGSDDVDSVNNPGIWFSNIRSPLDWGFTAEPSKAVNGRALILPMGKVIGGGSSINGSIYVRGHKSDYDGWARESGDAMWGYEHVLDIYRRIEDFQGPADAQRRGRGGLFHSQIANDPNPVAPAMVRAAKSVGIPSFDDINGAMMEGPGGCGLAQHTIKDGRRHSVAKVYLHPVMAQANLTVLTGAEVGRLNLSGKRVTGIEMTWRGKTQKIGASKEVILCAGAINSPRILMHSGIGDEKELKAAGIHVAHHLPGVGRNFQDHVLVAGCIWEYPKARPPRNNAAECTLFWKSDSRLASPDMQPIQVEIPFANEVTGKQFKVPPAAWSIAPGLVKPKSRGRLTVRGASPKDGVRIEANFLQDPADLKALVRAVELSREIGNSLEMREFVKREIMPGPMKGKSLENFVRNAASTYYHEVGTCRMGRDELAVVDAQLRARGIDGLRLADGSIMPEITGGNTMMPCVIIGERMGEILKAA